MTNANLATAEINIRNINNRLFDYGYNIRVAIEMGNESDPTDPTIRSKARMKELDENGYILEWLSPWLTYKEMRYWTTAYSLGLSRGLMQ